VGPEQVVGGTGVDSLSLVRNKDTLTSLVLPAYNPGQMVERTWREMRQFLRGREGCWEVIFVCDGCTDGTAERLAELNRGDSTGIRILSYTHNQGKGHAVRQGMLAARGGYRLFTDVDMAYGMDDVLRVADTLTRGADLAIASRTHRDSRLILPPHLQGYAYRRRLQSQVFSFLVRRLLSIPAFDTQAGLKGMTARAACTLMPALTSNGFGFDCELLTMAVRSGLAIVEVPVTVRYEDGASTTNLQAAGAMLAEVWRISRRPPIVPELPAPPKDMAAAA
jgi:dolichyl-phosphate beta-glucosyltransferase